MDKSCDNCYFKNHAKHDGFCTRYTDIQTDICDFYTFICKNCGDSAEWKYNGKHYCSSCALEKIGVEKRPYNSYQYFDAHGDYIGDSNELEDEDILLKCGYVDNCT